MKFLWLLVFLFFSDIALAQRMTITDVTVSVTDVSAAKAREKALDQAHSLAFQKLLQENFPETPGVVPPSDILMNMVANFSIDREKTTPKSYTASLTFQFDGPQVHTWLQEGSVSPSPAGSPYLPYGTSGPLKVTASYSTYAEWSQMKKGLEALPGVARVAVLSLSPQEANVDVFYGGGAEKLQQLLSQQGLLLTPQEDVWMLTAQTPSLP